MKPLFSIVIPFHNEGQKISYLAKSLKMLSLESPSYEVIFVDNKSTDDTVEILSQFGFGVESASAIASSYYARNVGASCARGQYLVFIDADCIVDPAILIEYAKCIESAARPEQTVFAGGIRAYKSKEGTLYERYASAKNILNQKSAITGWAYRNFAQTANAMFSLDAFLRVGGFDASMTSGGDAEISWRLADKLDVDFVFADAAFAYHQHRHDLDGLLTQFRKYGRGRIQQTLVSDKFVKEKKEDFGFPSAAAEKLLGKLEDLPLPENILFEVIDFVRDYAYSHGRMEEILNVAKKQSGGNSLESLRSLLRRGKEGTYE